MVAGVNLYWVMARVVACSAYLKLLGHGKVASLLTNLLHLEKLLLLVEAINRK
jgi:hypothetical protein